MVNTSDNALYFINSEKGNRMTQNYNDTVKQIVKPINEQDNDNEENNNKNSQDNQGKDEQEKGINYNIKKVHDKDEKEKKESDIGDKLLKAVDKLNNSINKNKNKAEEVRKKEKDNKIKSTDDIFWKDNISILFKFDNLLLFFPVGKMTMNQRLNALTRLCIYIGVILYLFTEKIYYIVLILISLVVIYVIHNNINKKEKFELDTTEKIRPTADNPFMNFNIITDDPQKPPAEDITKKEIKEDADDKFKTSSNLSNKLFRSTFDLYDRNNSQRQFYTMPSTTLPNDQTAFAKWCYSTGPTCKERTMYCAPNYMSNNPTKKDSNLQ